MTWQSEKKFFSENKGGLFLLLEVGGGGHLKPFSILQPIYPN